MAALLAACTTSGLRPEEVAGGRAGRYLVPAGIHKIKHVIIVMQENGSFDSYFGTFPGADGIPMRGGVPTACAPNPKRGAPGPTTTGLTATAAARTANTTPLPTSLAAR